MPARGDGAAAGSEPVSKAAPHPEAPFAARKRPRRMLQEASNGALSNVPFARLRAGFRGRFAAPQDVTKANFRATVLTVMAGLDPAIHAVADKDRLSFARQPLQRLEIESFWKVLPTLLALGGAEPRGWPGRARP